MRGFKIIYCASIVIKIFYASAVEYYVVQMNFESNDLVGSLVIPEILYLCCIFSFEYNLYKLYVQI